MNEKKTQPKKAWKKALYWVLGLVARRRALGPELGVSAQKWGTYLGTVMKSVP